MQPKLFVISILSLALLLFGCDPAGEPAVELDEDAITLQVRQAREASDAALLAGDIEAYLSYYTEDAVWLPPEAEEIVGKDVARVRLEGLFDELAVTGSYTIEEQTVMSPVWVSVRGQFNRVLTPKGDKGETEYQVGSFVNIWKKDTDGKWKIDVDIWNSDRGPTGADQATGHRGKL